MMGRTMATARASPAHGPDVAPGPRVTTRADPALLLRRSPSTQAGRRLGADPVLLVHEHDDRLVTLQLHLLVRRVRRDDDLVARHGEPRGRSVHADRAAAARPFDDI